MISSWDSTAPSSALEILPFDTRNEQAINRANKANAWGHTRETCRSNMRVRSAAIVGRAELIMNQSASTPYL